MCNISHIFSRKSLFVVGWIHQSQGPPVQKAMPWGARICHLRRKRTGLARHPRSHPVNGTHSHTSRAQHEAQTLLLILLALVFAQPGLLPVLLTLMALDPASASFLTVDAQPLRPSLTAAWLILICRRQSFPTHIKCQVLSTIFTPCSQTRADAFQEEALPREPLLAQCHLHHWPLTSLETGI